jgi:alkanesulfonate monooxygenase SsuD/methylene tetrahydromethanopterin reductase-like flavin-dependent oxidoreductase (luciferase family)
MRGLFDHLLPLWTDKSGPIYEGWTLLAALAAQTQRLRFPAMLAKIAATVDAISDGRLDFGFGIGGRPGTEPTPEYEAYGIPNAP